MLKETVSEKLGRIRIRFGDEILEPWAEYVVRNRIDLEFFCVVYCFA